jgi:hypothetical protein
MHTVIAICNIYIGIWFLLLEKYLKNAQLYNEDFVVMIFFICHFYIDIYIYQYKN